ncbi:hypothetical protein EYF80_043767 [Liparis tanakae]|uniref:MADF domain-containing protein n=1 Tax=Liparis tanakae TaxID=230148 RepID=A0A4Z2FZP7_9TELE|nr:hypothetical protein EYF80_043767 [Liparis tanakae]
MNAIAELLSEEVRRYEHLYNPSMAGYKDAQMASNSWREISSNVVLAVDLCLKMWRKLRDKYVSLTLESLGGGGALGNRDRAREEGALGERDVGALRDRERDVGALWERERDWDAGAGGQGAGADRDGDRAGVTGTADVPQGSGVGVGSRGTGVGLLPMGPGKQGSCAGSWTSGIRTSDGSCAPGFCSSAGSSTSGVRNSAGSWTSKVDTSDSSWTSKVATSDGSWGSGVATSDGSWGSGVARSTSGPWRDSRNRRLSSACARPNSSIRAKICPKLLISSSSGSGSIPSRRWVPGGPTLGSSVTSLWPSPVGFPPKHQGYCVSQVEIS